MVHVRTAYKCALMLRDMINPYLLRRMKSDVNIALPPKNDQVLFCRLTEDQKALYIQYLKSKEYRNIVSGNINALVGISSLRKLCNHPYLIKTGMPIHKNS